MTRHHASTAARDPRGGYIVRKPRASDPVGGSLRNIYEAEPRLPPEWASLLGRLDAVTH